MTGPTALPTPRVCSPFPGHHSEGPRWDGAGDELLWVDILKGHVHIAGVGADGQLGPVRTFDVGRHVGAVTPAAAGGYVAAAATGFVHIDESGALTELAAPEAGRTDVRMNDGVCDPQGRFWAGVMAYDEAPGAGRLYRLGLDGECTLVLDGLTIPNGMGWSPDGTTMYLADSGAGVIYAFDFDAATGGLSGRRVLVGAAPPGVPDGLTVDRGGDLWVAFWDGAAVRRYDPHGVLVSVVPVPADRPTSCAFGDVGGAVLFVSTSQSGLSAAALARQPEAGHLLRVEGLGTRGLPCTPYAGPVRNSTPGLLG
ncbi:MAG TPA: SMP-30/gluconolactonase/LRE family protein [Acidimicrobiales bacterium]|nr:SMP-30/gluconolactonase/LRE family protein [Acidimicrobiales bacterium]